MSSSPENTSSPTGRRRWSSAPNSSFDASIRSSSSNMSPTRRNTLSNFDPTQLLLRAIEEQDLSEVLYWLRHGANAESIQESASPLLEAVQRGNEAIVNALLAGHVNVDSVQTESGKTALHHAIQHWKVVIVDLLLQRGADVNLCSPSTHVSKAPPLIHAVEARSEEIVMKLLMHGADPLAIYGDEGKTALHRAVEWDLVEIALLFLDDDDKREDLLAAKDYSGRTSFHYAITQGDYRMVRLFLDSGVVFNENILPSVKDSRVRAMLRRHVGAQRSNNEGPGESPNSHRPAMAATKKRSRLNRVLRYPKTYLTHASSNVRSRSPPGQTLSHDDFQIAIICALDLEFDAVTYVFDEIFTENMGDPERSINDPTTYLNGRIGGHNVVLARVGMGKTNAAAASARIRYAYRRLKLALVVGICGGAPGKSNGQPDDEVLLGDVIISNTIVEYDFGTQNPDSFTPKILPQRPIATVENSLNDFTTKYYRESLVEDAAGYLRDLQAKAEPQNHGARYKYPGASKDRLFSPSYRHKHHGASSCICNACLTKDDPICKEAGASPCVMTDCDLSRLVPRDRLKEKARLEQEGNTRAQNPMIHIGRIASGDTVMRSGEHRDIIARKENAIAFEMEGAGVWNALPSLVIKGTCDYADSHKNDEWQHFAAAMAAATLKALLSRLPQATSSDFNS